jgi:UDP-GlcNAc3NAcA epimerase
MPEEINRVLTDHVSRWLFCPSEVAVDNLRREGISEGVHVVGDVMYDLVLRFGTSRALPATLSDRGIRSGQFVLATIHRAENTDDANRLQAIFGALADIARETDVVIPVHPRTRNRLAALPSPGSSRLHLVEPLSYLEMMAAQGHAGTVVTDSGGVQKEAFWLGVPCVTARDETEWIETLDDDRNVLTGADRAAIVQAVRRQMARGRLPAPDVASRGAGAEIIRILSTELAGVMVSQ